MEGGLLAKQGRTKVEGVSYLLQQQHRARLQLSLVCLQKHSVHRPEHLSWKSHRSPSQGPSPGLESGLLISGPQWKSLVRNTQDPLLTRGILKNHTGVHCAPSQGLDHHRHVGDLVPGELLEGCLLTRKGTH